MLGSVEGALGVDTKRQVLTLNKKLAVVKAFQISGQTFPEFCQEYNKCAANGCRISAASVVNWCDPSSTGYWEEYLVMANEVEGMQAVRVPNWFRALKKLLEARRARLEQQPAGRLHRASRRRRLGGHPALRLLRAFPVGFQ